MRIVREAKNFADELICRTHLCKYFKSGCFVLQKCERTSRAMLVGTILHEIFQKAGINFTQEKLKEIALSAVHGPKYLKEL